MEQSEAARGSPTGIEVLHAAAATEGALHYDMSASSSSGEFCCLLQRHDAVNFRVDFFRLPLKATIASNEGFKEYT